jgi:hypothetical protein
MGKRVGTYVLPFFGLGSGGDHQGGAPREAAMAGGIREASCVSVTQRNEMGCWGLREGALMLKCSHTGMLASVGACGGRQCGGSTTHQGTQGNGDGG